MFHKPLSVSKLLDCRDRLVWLVRLQLASMKEESNLDTLEARHVPSNREGSLAQSPSSERPQPENADSRDEDSSERQADSKSGDFQETARKVRHEGSRLLQRAGSGIEDRADRYVDNVSHRARSASEATRDAARNLQNERADVVSEAFDWVSEQIDEAADYFEQRDARELANDVGDVIREHPAITLGGLATAGFLTARFLRASDEDERSD